MRKQVAEFNGIKVYREGSFYDFEGLIKGSNEVSFWTQKNSSQKDALLIAEETIKHYKIGPSK